MSDYQPADYSACARWPQGCFSCRHFMLREVYFCRAYNAKRFGQDVVRVELDKTRGPWWAQVKCRKAR